jgi:hypothetical protein
MPIWAWVLLGLVVLLIIWWIVRPSNNRRGGSGGSGVLDFIGDVISGSD